MLFFFLFFISLFRQNVAQVFSCSKIPLTPCFRKQQHELCSGFTPSPSAPRNQAVLITPCSVNFFRGNTTVQPSNLLLQHWLPGSHYSSLQRHIFRIFSKINASLVGDITSKSSGTGIKVQERNTATISPKTGNMKDTQSSIWTSENVGALL